MALTLLFRTAKRSKIGSITLDATLSAEHSMENEVTQFPVEDGSNISDHIIHKPRRFSIEGIVSETPVRVGGTARKAFNEGVEATFKKLEEMHKSGELITITTPLTVYKDMAIESITCNIDPSTGRALPIVCRVVQVRRAAPKSIEVTIRRPKQAKAAPKQDKGRLAGADATASQAAKTRSLLLTLADLIAPAAPAAP